MQGQDGLTHSAFQVDGSVVFQLGEGLITDDVQALVELVKNSYDADASWVKVIIDSGQPGPGERPGAEAKGPVGSITVTDNGFGMTLEDIERGWLTIAGSPKRDVKARGGTTPGGRTPLGDKGLGRLGTQRLATEIEIRTHPASDPASPPRDRVAQVQHEVAFSWDAFREGRAISAVPVDVRTQPLDEPRESGTTVVLRGLRNREHWETATARASLVEGLSFLLSPYKVAKDFRVHLEIDGDQRDLSKITREVRRAACMTYSFTYALGSLSVEGKVKLDYLRPRKENDQLFGDHVLADNGDRLRQYLMEQTALGTFQPRASDDPWFLSFRFSTTLRELGGVALDAESRLADPGPFRGEIDAFTLDEEGRRQQSVYTSLSEYRKVLKSLSGIGVYRDGFGVRMDRDWLNLSRGWTAGPSWYTLRPNSTLGYVALSARDNRHLEEKTDREGFTDTPQFRNFRLLMEHVIREANRLQTVLRRSTDDYLKQLAEEKSAGQQGEAQHGDDPETVAAQLVRASVAQAKDRVEVMDLLTAPPLTGGRYAGGRVLEAIERLRAAEPRDSGTIRAAQVLLLQVERLRAQADELFELASLGLAAEVFSHEVQYVADRLAEASRRARNVLRHGDISPMQVRAFVEHVHSSIAALRKQLAYLTPTLKYVRENRERIEVAQYLREVFAEYHEPRLARSDIRLSVEICRSGEFAISMNRGKLTQVFDNLLLNSEYWLREAMRRRELDDGEVRMVVERPMVRFSDSGPGVPHQVEDSLFDPFVTTKPSGEGRGMGLFIASQLLETEGCSIALAQERNTHGRRYIFDVYLGGALHG